MFEAISSIPLNDVLWAKLHDYKYNLQKKTTVDSSNALFKKDKPIFFRNSFRRFEDTLMKIATLV